VRTLVVAPTRREARALGDADAASDGAALTRLLEERRPKAVLIAGVCGGLDPSLAAGGLLLAREVVAPGEAPLRPREALLQEARAAMRRSRLPFVSSRVLSATAPAASRREKTDLWNEHGAGGVDMEGYALALACEAAGIPWLLLRSVVDTAERALPASLHAWRSEEEERAALLAALRRPWEWPAYAGLGRAIGRALRSLRGAAAVLRQRLEAMEVSPPAGADRARGADLPVLQIARPSRAGE
jgi:hypothetical protein